MPKIKTAFSLRLDLTSYAKIKKIANLENRSINKMIEHLVQREIKNYESLNGEIMLSDDDLYLKQ